MEAKKLIGHIMVATGMTVPEWAEANSWSKAAVYHVIGGNTKRGRIRLAIAETIGIEANEIWPSDQ